MAEKEYIEREKVLALKQEIGAYGMNICSAEVEELPAADVVEVKHGEWEPYGMTMSGIIGNWHCSICKGTSLKSSAFCPNCGARMDGERKEGK